MSELCRVFSALFWGQVASPRSVSAVQDRPRRVKGTMKTTESYPVDELKKFVAESDRGCMLLLVARLDGFLEELHREYIIAAASPPKKILNGFFAPLGPLASFFGKIQLGYAYGIIAHEDFLDLERIRKLRNAAAHSDEPFSFDDPLVKEQVRQISTPERVSKVLPRKTLGIDLERQLYHPLTDDPQTTRFYLVLSSLFLQLTLREGLTKLIHPDE